MIYCWLSTRELWAPSPEDPHRRVTGPIVFEAPDSYFHRARHPKLILYKHLDQYESLLGSKKIEKLHKDAGKLLTTSTEELSYRELQKVAKERGIKADGTYDELLLRVEGSL